MKRILPILFVLIGISTSAQIVNIPDPVFKYTLVHYSDLFNHTIDTNNDGEIQYSEAAAFSSWGGGYYLYIQGKNISDLTGIKAFSALHSLFCNDNNLTALDVSGMHLDNLFCQNNALTSLDITGCGDYLRGLYCENNDLSSLDLSGQNSLLELLTANNNLSSLSLNGAPMLGSLDCNHNHLTSLDISQTSIKSLTCADNQLTSLTLKNSYLFTFHDGTTSTQFNCTGNPGLQYICADAGEAFFLLEYCIQNGMPLMQIDTTCSFSTSSGYSTINGQARVDLDNNGCSSLDPAKPFMQLKLINDNDSNQTLIKKTDSSGAYTFYTYAGNYSVVPNLPNPYYMISPDTLHVTATTGTIQHFDFCIAPNGIHNDLDIIINYVVAFVDGTCHAKITYKNKGTETMSGNVQFIFDDNKVDFLSSLPPINNQSNGLVTWNFSNLQPFETRDIDVSLYLLPPPVNNISDTLTFTANINTVASDETPSDNTFIFRAPVSVVVIPITIEYFKGAIQSGKHLLNWKAACAGLQATFNIERSTDGRNYYSLTSITASNTRCLQPFDFTDNDPAAGINYYRIKMTDVDGKISYSTVIALLNKQTGFEIVNLSPNPVTGGTASLNITSAEKQIIHIKVSDASGEIVQAKDRSIISGFTNVNMNFSKLAAGIYTISIYTNNGERKTIQFVNK
ncbi:MAG: T9SS type A sorting domain-containing protein [Ferruginibacter sp.]